MDFLCNICGRANSGVEEIGREAALCTGCGSSMRHRSIIAVLSRELLGAVYPLDKLPVLRSIRGLGLSDSQPYARLLADHFDYRNTYLHREPVLDIAGAGSQDPGTLDFLLASEVFEHVPPPVEGPLRKVRDLLRPEGVFVMTVPYGLEGETLEHFPELADYATVLLRSGPVLVNRTREGALQVFSDLVFHGGRGSTLELRVFSEPALRKALSDAGFGYVRVYTEDFPEFGIVHQENWALPIAARRRAPETNRALLCELLERNWKDSSWSLKEENDRLRADLVSRTDWAKSLESDLAARTDWARALDAQLEERTAWARRLEEEVKTLEGHLSRTRCSLWYRLGRRLGLIY